MSRRFGALAAVTALAAVLLFVFPPLGVVAAVALLVVVPPWGRSLSERAVISAVVLLGLAAIVFPRAGSTPVTPVSARLALVVLIVGALLLRLVPGIRNASFPRPSVADGVVALLAVIQSAWFISAYHGRRLDEVISGLFFSGWDNQGHFTTFANTYTVGSTTWPTVDGSVAWNQWYPSLHTTVWALGEKAVGTGEQLSRSALVYPYVQWSAISFALCMAAVAWVAGDVAARIGGRVRERWTRPLAAGTFALFALLGTPAFLFNSGFTNFAMGVTVMVVVAYISARTLRSARLLGWFLVPLGCLAAIGLWTPLALGMVPSGVVVAVALWKHRTWMSVVWVAASVVLGAYLALTQTAAILGVEPGQSTSDFTKGLGAVTTGMVPFNIGMALISPLLAIAIVVLLVRAGRWPLGVAIAGPVIGAGLVALYFVTGADSAGIGRLESYYVLKPMDAMLIAIAPAICALVIVGLARALDGLSTTNRVIATIAVGLFIIGSFGYPVGLPKLSDGYSVAPGMQAGADRMRGINDPLIGLAISRGAEGAVPYPDDTTLLWDGAGTLPNLWVASLHGVMSKTQQAFYRDLPPFPYDKKTASYVDLTLNLNPSMNVVVLWFRPSSGTDLDSYVASRGDGRVTSVRIPMEPNALCPECTP